MKERGRSSRKKEEESEQWDLIRVLSLQCCLFTAVAKSGRVRRDLTRY